ncbi:hypothetical protein [Plasmodium yoelii yoelii]|uniref:Uncharacterized protein n=1 Tax=Plasmodium yoelii yoelii TaxID=73239 RepID=Q7R9M8_PLAYO|nr:hypothetical protein [Plasmodium yoelii yoelii]
MHLTFLVIQQIALYIQYFLCFNCSNYSLFVLKLISINRVSLYALIYHKVI